MKTRIKTAREIEAMRDAGRILATVLSVVSKRVTPGISTKELANVAASELKAIGGEPSFLGHQGFPDVICISVNDEIVHGMPDPKRILQDGDIVGIDFGVTCRGMMTDGAISVIAGHPCSKQDQMLIETTKDALYAGIKRVRDGARTGDIGAAIEAVLKPHNYGIPHDLVGHGIGSELWEDPHVPNYGTPNTGALLRAGMTIAIEPMVTLGSSHIRFAEDGWTIKTTDGSRAAHFEHTVLILNDGAEILTQE
jgi:methionyl aminopeptidase